MIFSWILHLMDRLFSRRISTPRGILTVINVFFSGKKNKGRKNATHWWTVFGKVPKIGVLLLPYFWLILGELYKPPDTCSLHKYFHSRYQNLLKIPSPRHPVASYSELMIGVSNHLQNAKYLGFMKPFSEGHLISGKASFLQKQLFKKKSAGRIRRRGTALTSQRQQRKPLHVSWTHLQKSNML